MPSYKFNQNYFDVIDTPNKAYWLGFIWADGYVVKRERQLLQGKRIEYNFKLSVQSNDSSHLEKFVKDIDGNYLIRFYQYKGIASISGIEARLFISNKYFASLLYEKYKIMPRRSDPTELISFIPEELYRYFLLGVFDGDGSFTAYRCAKRDKLNVAFGGSVELLNFIEKWLYQEKVIVSDKHKFYQRHKNRDGQWRSLILTGKTQGMKVLNYLYKDSPIYLERKYQKYLEIPYHQH